MSKRFKVPARRLAGRVLRRVLDGKGSARDQLDWSFQHEPPSERDRGLVTELVYGALRHLATLDLLLGHLSSRPLHKVHDGALIQLRLGAYQLLYLERIPDHAAIHEAVEAVPHRGAKTFVNAILRSLTRLIVDRGPVPEDPFAEPRSRRLPVSAELELRLGEDALPSEPEAWMAAVLGLPRSHSDGLIARWGRAEAWRIGLQQNATPPLSLRLNLRKTTREAALEALRADGLEVREGERPESVRVEAAGRSVATFPGFAEGQMSVQDETAMSVAPFLQPQPGDRVLDLCAAPGGKATHLAELVGEEGEVIATDIAAARLPKIISARERLGVGHLQVVPRSAIASEATFDRILVDVPCSNTGVMRRRVELRHRLNELDRRALAATQASILKEGLGLLKEGGRLVYSTCSIDAAENGELVRAVLSELKGRFELEAEDERMPSEHGDGGYMARIKRVGGA